MTLVNLPQRIDNWLSQASGQNSSPRRLIVAYSGGLDSTVLLHALRQQLPAGTGLLALHIHHGMQVQADDWAEHCRAFCAQHEIAFEQRCVEVNAIAELGPEAAARQARYAAFEAILEPDDVLLLAHHQQDQAETLLLQLLRGSGVAGLAAMPRVAIFSSGWLLRPLLDVSKQDLEAYAQAQNLVWIEDPSNQDRDLDRVFLRHEIMPLLRQRWPAADRQLARSAAHAATATELLAALADEDLAVCICPDGQSLSISALQRLGVARSRNVLRAWIRGQGADVPSTAVTKQIEQDLLGAREDAEPLIHHGPLELRRYRDQLFALPRLPAAPGDLRIGWDLQGELVLPEGCGRLRASADVQTATGNYEIGFPRGGERIRPRGCAHHRQLKQLFQESGVPPWVRRRMPLIYHGHHLVAVADRWISADAPAQGLALQWLDAPPGWMEVTQDSCGT